MRILFFSDIHGNRYVLDPLEKLIKDSKPDMVIFCGDIFGYYYYQSEIIDRFMSWEIECLLGNHDQYFLDLLEGKLIEENLILKYGNSYLNIGSKISESQFKWISELKPYKELTFNDFKIGIFHGSPQNPLNGRIYPDTIIDNNDIYTKYNLVVLGHTHHKMYRKINDTIILNPGSIGQQRDGKGCSVLIFDTNSKSHTIHNVNYNIKKLEIDIMKNDPERKEFIEVLNRKYIKE